MSVALADFLITVSDPMELKKYQEAPQELLAEYPLTPGDLQALRSGSPGWIRYQTTLAEDRSDLSTSHPDVQNANGFSMNNQSNTNTSNNVENSSPDSDADLIDEDGNPVPREP